jgi:hypothetical protein
MGVRLKRPVLTSNIYLIWSAPTSTTPMLTAMTALFRLTLH